MDNPIFLALMLLPYSGYKAARDYNLSYLVFYIIYCVLIFISKIVQFYNVLYKKYDYLDDYSDNYIIWLDIFNAIYIIIQLWILKIVFRFYNELIRLTFEKRNKLLVGTYIPVVTTYMFN
jgi:hypothetical protein